MLFLYGREIVLAVAVVTVLCAGVLGLLLRYFEANEPPVARPMKLTEDHRLRLSRNASFLAENAEKRRREWKAARKAATRLSALSPDGKK